MTFAEFTTWIGFFMLAAVGAALAVGLFLTVLAMVLKVVAKVVGADKKEEGKPSGRLTRDDFR